MATTILKLSCPDRVGLLARISGWVAERGGNLVAVHQFTDPAAGWFFTRMEIDTATFQHELSALREGFRPLAEEIGASWTLRAAESRPRVILMVSKLGHCLADLLWRWRAGEFAFDIPCVISNHGDFRDEVEREGLPFHQVPVPCDAKAAAFATVRRIWDDSRADVVVLARYMQILPPELCSAMPGRIINIHHSFLPSFVGANPYQRAYDRGVKLIGATCHYVTGDLDEGPIIDQEVIRVEHSHTVPDLLRLGRDCERLALARSLRWHLADQVLIHGNKTVVFRD